MTDIELRSLAPEYSEDHHKTYVARLNAAVADQRNKNIALTGRYGAGKSSILDEFVKDQERTPEPPASKWSRLWQKARRSNERPTKVLRISINTLGPDKGEDLTNRIQKELVKQLIYRAKPGEVRRSDFARAPELTWWRAGLEALIVTVALVGLLWLFGLHPDEESLGTDGVLWPMIAFFALVFTILWAIRWYIGSRVVAQVSAGGASIALEGKSASFFDKYLDELIAFFEATEPDIVVFEDLDRFDDPRIFDSLRELNALVNTSAHWRDRPDRPLRFVYAIKDSLFEKLGDKQQEKDESWQQNPEEGGTSVSEVSAPVTTDKRGNNGGPNADTRIAAAEAMERANRTKFFELVIPVVPFLSHSNARDHFLNELGKLKLPRSTKIDHRLIDIVARHTTDMRLMINIGNEFVVYAERLLWVDEDKLAPGLTADRLFALVVYKNFHLADFEAIPHRNSALDTLDKSRRDLVDESIKNLQKERAELVRGAKQLHEQEARAKHLGTRLETWLSLTHLSLQSATVNGVALDVLGTSLPAFWRPIAQAQKVELALFRANRSYASSFDYDALQTVFPEATDASAWLDSPSQSDKASIADIDRQIADLRGADFQALTNDNRYTFGGRTFVLLAEDALPSQLARDLVRQGHIDRFYAEYATVFYGKFLGVDVAKFFRNSVWPNEMDAQFAFTTEGAAANVLAQAPSDFLWTRSALNIDIVDHLMSLDASLSSDLVDFLAGPHNTEGRQFLTTYFNTPGSRSKELVSRLAAKPWPGLFSFIASEGTIDADETNVELINAALLSAPGFENFDLDDVVLELIRRLHTEIPAFRDPQPGASVKTRLDFLTNALPGIPTLRAISPALQQAAVNAKQYVLGVDNIRTAAGLQDEEQISADNLIDKRAVWAYCTENVDAYLELVESDEHTSWSCASPEVLAQVVDAQHEAWSVDQLGIFLEASAESAALPNIDAVEQTVWETVIIASRAVPNLTNLAAYASEIGVDDALAALLSVDDGAVVDIVGLEDGTAEQLEPLIPLLLNAQAVLEPRQRVLLAKQLLDSPARPGFNLSEISASPDEVLAQLLQESIIEDSDEVFAHFSGAGWPSIGPALRVSKNAATFITPALVQGHAAEVVRDKSFQEVTRHAILERLREFAPTEDQSFLIAAASAARTLRVSLSKEALTLIAPVVRNPDDIVWQLREQSSSITASAAMQILGRMPGDFAGFAGATGQKFEVVDTPSLEAVLIRLRRAGVIVPQPGRQPRGRWKLRIA